MNPQSWIIVERATDSAVAEFYKTFTVSMINTEKYEVISSDEYLRRQHALMAKIRDLPK